MMPLKVEANLAAAGKAVARRGLLSTSVNISVSLKPPIGFCRARVPKNRSDMRVVKLINHVDVGEVIAEMIVTPVAAEVSPDVEASPGKRFLHYWSRSDF